MSIQLPLLNNDKPKEECGVIGVYNPNNSTAARSVYWGLSALQHRGQEAAGIASWQEDRINIHKDTGLVSSVFHEQHLQQLTSHISIGHVRYSTTGDGMAHNAGPMLSEGKRQVAVAHNGNLVNAKKLAHQLTDQGYSFQSTSDSEILSAKLALEEESTWLAMKRVMHEVQGAFSLIVMAENKLFACRDPHGIRPLVLGLLPNEDTPGYVVASETCALDLLGAQYLRDIVAGEIVEISDKGLRTEQVKTPVPRNCSFEAIYFSRPDSKLGSESVYNIRLRLGQELAKDYPVEADMVIGVPDSGVPMAIGYSNKTDMAYSEAIIRNRYIARTFIEPTEEERVMAVKKKLNPIAQSIAGKRLVVVDDSLVRGTTIKTVVSLLRTAGAIEVHLRIGSPPARHPCFYGVDMGRPGEYIAEGRNVEEIAKIVGADSLHYLSIEGLSRALRRPLNKRCTACFTGDYPIESIQGEQLAYEQLKRNTIGN